jgi:hypothetical protein
LPCASSAPVNDFDGFRLTLAFSTLAVSYITNAPVPDPTMLGALGLGGTIASSFLPLALDRRLGSRVG